MKVIELETQFDFLYVTRKSQNIFIYKIKRETKDTSKKKIFPPSNRDLRDFGGNQEKLKFWYQIKDNLQLFWILAIAKKYSRLKNLG